MNEIKNFITNNKDQFLKEILNDWVKNLKEKKVLDQIGYNIETIDLNDIENTIIEQKCNLNKNQIPKLIGRMKPTLPSKFIKENKIKLRKMVNKQNLSLKFNSRILPKIYIFVYVERIINNQDDITEEIYSEFISDFEIALKENHFLEENESFAEFIKKNDKILEEVLPKFDSELYRSSNINWSDVWNNEINQKNFQDFMVKSNIIDKIFTKWLKIFVKISFSNEKGKQKIFKTFVMKFLKSYSQSTITQNKRKMILETEFQYSKTFSTDKQGNKKEETKETEKIRKSSVAYQTGFLLINKIAQNINKFISNLYINTTNKGKLDFKSLDLKVKYAIERNENDQPENIILNKIYLHSMYLYSILLDIFKNPINQGNKRNKKRIDGKLEPDTIFQSFEHDIKPEYIFELYNAFILEFLIFLDQDITEKLLKIKDIDFENYQITEENFDINRIFNIKNIVDNIFKNQMSKSLEILQNNRKPNINQNYIRIIFSPGQKNKKERYKIFTSSSDNTNPFFFEDDRETLIKDLFSIVKNNIKTSIKNLDFIKKIFYPFNQNDEFSNIKEYENKVKEILSSNRKNIIKIYPPFNEDSFDFIKLGTINKSFKINNLQLTSDTMYVILKKNRFEFIREGKMDVIHATDKSIGHILMNELTKFYDYLFTYKKI